MRTHHPLLPELTRVAQVIYDKKGFNILVLDVRRVCNMTDYFILAEGTVDRHVRAISHAIVDEFERRGWPPLHVEGEREGEWVVIDYGSMVIHLLVPELREKYALEELWRNSEVVDVNIQSHVEGA